MKYTTTLLRRARAAAGAALVCAIAAPAAAQVTLDLIRMPEGFKIEVFAEGVDNARSLARSPEGTLFVGSRNKGNVYAVVDENNDYKADKVHVLATGLNMPNGVEFIDGDLYVAEVSRILRWDDIESKLENPGEPTVVDDSFPTEKHHGWKYLAQGPDGKLYTNIGAPCNICDPGDPFATIVRFDLDGSNREIIARGVRNSVGFAWDPESGDLWFTDNGRDMLGDNRPPCELNHLEEVGQHFGYPYVHGNDILDPEFGAGKNPNNYVKPAQELGPHVAPLGMKFYDGAMFPAAYKGMIFIAEHGSWNRSSKIGYRIMRVTLDENDNAVSYDVFADGWLQGEEDWGRPVDLLVLPDGSMLVSDDKASVIYRISYEG